MSSGVFGRRWASFVDLLLTLKLHVAKDSTPTSARQQRRGDAAAEVEAALRMGPDDWTDEDGGCPELVRVGCSGVDDEQPARRLGCRNLINARDRDEGRVVRVGQRVLHPHDL